jgi:Mrp family chromosome partitioning ATPase
MDLYRHFRQLWDARGPIAVFAWIAGLATAGVLATQQPLYEATTVVSVNAESEVNLAEQTALLASTYVELALSAPTFELAADEGDTGLTLRELRARVDVERQGLNFLAIRARGESREQALALARDFEAALEAMVIEYHTVDRARALAPLESELESIGEQLQEAEAGTIETRVLEERYLALANALADRSTRLPGGISLVSPPTATPRPIAPVPWRGGLVAALIAAVLGGEALVGYRAVRGRLARTNADAEVAHLTGFPVVLSLERREASVGSPSIGTLHRQLEVRRRHGTRTLSIVSAQSGGETSRVAGLLAEHAAEVAGPVVLVDTDLQDALLSQRLGLPRSPGLAELLRGDVDVEECITPVGGNDGLLWYLPAGGPVEEPLRTVGDGAVARLREALVRSRCDARDIVLAGPGLTPSSAGGLALAAQADDVLLVVDGASIRRHELRDIASLLNRVGIRPAGVVLLCPPPSRREQRAYRRGDAGQDDDGHPSAGHVGGQPTSLTSGHHG